MIRSIRWRPRRSYPTLVITLRSPSKGALSSDFVSAVEYVHPDKPAPELWINEVGVASTHRGRGVGKATLQAVLNLARERGCSEAWVLTGRANIPAMRLYGGCGGVEAAEDSVMFTFPLV